MPSCGGLPYWAGGGGGASPAASKAAASAGVGSVDSTIGAGGASSVGAGSAAAAASAFPNWPRAPPRRAPPRLPRPWLFWRRRGRGAGEGGGGGGGLLPLLGGPRRRRPRSPACRLRAHDVWAESAGRAALIPRCRTGRRRFAAAGLRFLGHRTRGGAPRPLYALVWPALPLTLFPS